jgi:hypothetical protein
MDSGEVSKLHSNFITEHVQYYCKTIIIIKVRGVPETKFERF